MSKPITSNPLKQEVCVKFEDPPNNVFSGGIVVPAKSFEAKAKKVNGEPRVYARYVAALAGGEGK